MNNILDTSYRHEVYKKMLALMRQENLRRISVDGSEALCCGLCYALRNVVGFDRPAHIEFYGELIKHRPKLYTHYWFNRSMDAGASKRIAILEQAIKETASPE